MIFSTQNQADMNLSKALIFLFSLLIISPCIGQPTWTQLANHPSGGIERTFSFELDSLVYVGCGRESNGLNTTKVWAYDQETDSWSRKANFPGAGRRNAFAFQAGGFAYMGTGYNGSNAMSDFWRYNSADDIWTQLADFPGGGRNFSVAVSEGDKAYVMAGNEHDNNRYNDMWEFDATTESWTMLQNFPGQGRWLAFGWIIDQTVYIGGGTVPQSGSFQDLYAYDLTTGIWEQKEPSPTIKTAGGFSFSIKGKGYYVEGAIQFNTGYGNKVFVYDPISDMWSEELMFIGPTRSLGFCSVVGNKAILGTGKNNEIDSYYNDVYSFTLETISPPTSIQDAKEVGVSVFPNPVSSSELFIEGEFLNTGNMTFNIYDMNGKLISTSSSKTEIGNVKTLDIGQLAQGMYQLEIIGIEKRMSRKFIVR